MSWIQFHQKSETLALEAESALREGHRDEALNLYGIAADAEDQALGFVNASKARTLGITVVSAVSLRYKAEQLEMAQAAAYRWLATGDMPDFARTELEELLQTIWNELALKRAGLKFAPGQVTISVRGGEVVRGGAPLDLIVEKVQTIQSLFYRTAEWIRGLPHRRRGGPTGEIQEACRPWLFQTAPGSYQFAVAVQEPRQGHLFERRIPSAQELSGRFLQILRAAVDNPETALPELVPDKDYRSTFLKLTRNLAPSGKRFNELEIRALDEKRPITLVPAMRSTIRDAIKELAPKPPSDEPADEDVIRGVLRAVHLDRDWIEVSVEGHLVHIIQTGDAVDDAIGPMVNRPVAVQVLRDAQGKLHFRDIEAED